MDSDRLRDKVTHGNKFLDKDNKLKDVLSVNEIPLDVNYMCRVTKFDEEHFEFWYIWRMVELCNRIERSLSRRGKNDIRFAKDDVGRIKTLLNRCIQRNKLGELKEHIERADQNG